MHDTSLNLRALMYAECCFETFRCMDAQVFLLDQHIQRLSRGLANFGLKLPPNLMHEAIQQATHTAYDCLVRVTVGGGHAAWGLQQQAKPESWIQAFPIAKTQQRIHLQQVTWPFPLYASDAKYTADYALTLRALKQLSLAKHQQALICDATGIHTAMTSNVLLYRHGRWVTPPSDKIISGVVRGFLLAQGVIVAESCPLDMCQDVEAIALTNSGWFIAPVNTLNGRELRTTGEIFDRLWQPLLSQRGVKRTC